MSEVKKLLFIVNKYSGAGYKPQLEGRILRACKRQGIECSIEFTTAPGHATRLAQEAVHQNFKSVIAVGGDGTVNEVASGLVHSHMPMGILPKGSGNGLARHLGISRNIDRALKQILSGKVIQMDTFTLNRKLSVNVSGIGFDGHVANLFSTGKKRGLRGYAKLVAGQYIRFKEFAIDVDLNTKQLQNEKAFMVAIANSSQYGNNARVSPKSSVKDQTLQLALIKKISLHRGMSFGFKMFAGKLKPGKKYKSLSFQNGVLKTPHPVAFHVDGEACGHADEFTIEMLPQSLYMIVPVNRINKV